jgi:frataxin-like iron-binding protein CyaY
LNFWAAIKYSGLLFSKKKSSWVTSHVTESLSVCFDNFTL